VTTGSHLQAISDFDGTFRLSAATHANLSNSRVLNNFCTIKGALVFLELPFSSLVHIELFNLGGAKLKGEFKKWLSSGSYKYDLFQICNASNGIYIAKTQVGKAVSLFKIIKVNHTHLPFPNKSTSSFCIGVPGKKRTLMNLIQ